MATRLNKIDAALRQELANAIHDMDDGKLNNSRLHTLQGKINNKLYNNDDDDEDCEEEEHILPTIYDKYDDYIDNIRCSMDDGITDDYFCDLRDAIENLAVCSNKKEVNKYMKEISKSFNDLQDCLKDTIKNANITLKSSDVQLKKIKADVAKDLKKVK